MPRDRGGRGTGRHGRRVEPEARTIVPADDDAAARRGPIVPIDSERDPLAPPARAAPGPADDNPLAAAPRPKTEPRGPRRRLGEYRIVRLVGEGAMGKVYEAEQASLGRRVALKVLPKAFAQDEQAVERFEREARAAAAMHHPNVVQVYGSGREGGQYYYAMEYVQGRSLRELLKDPERPLADERKVAKYVLQVALAVDYAHGLGVIHRDLKPDNIIVREDDQAMVTDFGLARNERARTITQVGALMGTPVYMAPEQAMGRSVDGRIDVYALGVTLYECLTGRLPFLHKELRALLVMIREEDPTPLRELRPDVSPDLEAICHKALAKDPADRYPSGKALADDLIRFFRGDVAEARQARWWQVAVRKMRKAPVVTGLVVLVCALALAVTAIALRSGGPDTDRASVLLSEARDLVDGPLDRYRQAAGRLDEARGAASRDLNRALVSFREVEEALLAARGDRGAPADVALDRLGEVMALLPRDHPEAIRARELAVELVWAQWRQAERQGDLQLAAAHKRQLSELGALDSGRRERPLVTVTTTPPGAAATLYRVETGPDGTWTLGPPRDLGATPVEPGIEVEPGEYVVELRADGRVPVRVPTEVRATVRGRALAALEVDLPLDRGIPLGFAYIAPGETYLGGDPQAVRPLYRTREPEFVPGFFLARHEVTVGEYVEFLNALPAGVRRDHLPPRLQIGATGDGRATASPDVLDHAVAGVRLQSARAYCQWRTERRGGFPRFRLPRDAEWEKAARGPRGRAFPWGDAFDVRRADRRSVLHTGAADGPCGVRAVGSAPGDESVYGIRDMGGNVSEWVEGQFGGDPRFGVLRGGSWARGPEVTRAASRMPVDSSVEADFLRVFNRVGFRLAFDVE